MKIGIFPQPGMEYFTKRGNEDGDGVKIDTRPHPHPRSGINFYPHPHPHPRRGWGFFAHAGQGPDGGGESPPHCHLYSVWPCEPTIR